MSCCNVEIEDKAAASESLRTQSLQCNAHINQAYILTASAIVCPLKCGITEACDMS